MTIEDLTPQQLMAYMNRIIDKHNDAAMDRLNYLPGNARREKLTEEMKSLERLFQKARLLSEQRKYIIFH